MEVMVALDSSLCFSEPAAAAAAAAGGGVVGVGGGDVGSEDSDNVDSVGSVAAGDSEGFEADAGSVDSDSGVDSVVVDDGFAHSVADCDSDSEDAGGTALS
jgi:hypothetical protein